MQCLPRGFSTKLKLLPFCDFLELEMLAYLANWLFEKDYTQHEYNMGIPLVDSLATAIAMYFLKELCLFHLSAKESPTHSRLTCTIHKRSTQCK